MATVPLLLIEDSPADAALIEETLHSGATTRYRLHHAATLAEGTELASSHAFGAVLLDLNLPDVQGLATVRSWLAGTGLRPVIVLTGEGDGETGPKAIQEGAQDYFPRTSSAPR